jgi:hypothetical protein
VVQQLPAGHFLKTFREFPMRQKSAKFKLDDVINELRKAQGG